MGPLVKNTVIDGEKNITYHVMTPQAMSLEETARAVRMYLTMTPARKRPKRNTTCTIMCPVGVLGMGGDR